MQIKWICPTAPTQPISIFGGFPSTACKCVCMEMLLIFLSYKFAIASLYLCIYVSTKGITNFKSINLRCLGKSMKNKIIIVMRRKVVMEVELVAGTYSSNFVRCIANVTYRV